MATILVFKAEERAPDGGASLRTRRHPQAAEIIIFPGVRYERTVGPEASTRAARQADATHRDRLELIE
jgi:hypothetical protein